MENIETSVDGTNIGLDLVSGAFFVYRQHATEHDCVVMYLTRAELQALGTLINAALRTEAE